MSIGLIGGSMLAAGGPTIAAGAIVLVCAFALAVARPMTALYVGISSIAIDAFTLPLGASQLRPYELMFIITAAGWCTRRFMRRQPLLVESPLRNPLLLLVATSWLGLVLVPDPVHVVRIPLVWTVFFLLYQLVVAEADTHSIRTIAMLLCVVGGVSGVLAIAQIGSKVCGPTSCISVGTAQRLGEAAAAGRATTSAFAQPNRLGEFLALVIPFQLALAATGDRRIRLVAALTVIPTVWALVLTLSREAFLGIALALIFLLFAWKPFRWVVATFLTLAVLATISGWNPLTTWFPQLTGRLQSIGQLGNDPRIVAYERTPAMIRDHLVFGVGPDQYPTFSARYGIVDPNTGFPLIHAHNLPLNIAAERGLVGLAAFLWWAFVVARTLIGLYRRADPFLRSLDLALIAAFLTLLAGAFADYAWQQNNILALTWILAGAAVVLLRSRAPVETASSLGRLSPNAAVPLLPPQ